MAMPDFTAETSLYRTGSSYRRGLRTGATPTFVVVPQQRLESTCGDCSCWPWHCCKTVGGGCQCTSCSAPPDSAVTAPATLLRA